MTKILFSPLECLLTIAVFALGALAIEQDNRLNSIENQVKTNTDAVQQYAALMAEPYLTKADLETLTAPLAGNIAAMMQTVPTPLSPSSGTGPNLTNHMAAGDEGAFARSIDTDITGKAQTR